MRYAARTDRPHKAITQALRKVGCKVSDTSRVGKGFPDLVVRMPVLQVKRMVPPSLWGSASFFGARIVLMEVKTEKGTLTPEQERFIADFPETLVVRSVEEALKAVGL